MFTQLLASRPARHEGSQGTAVSVIVHGALITAAIIATATRPVTETPRQSFVVPLTAPVSKPQQSEPRARPRTPERPAPTTPTITETVPVDVPPVVAPTDVPSSLPVVSEAGDPVLYPEPCGTPSTGDPSGSPIGTGVYGAESVDVAARLLPHSPLPRYPEMLKAQRLEGGARLRFVVNADGRVELSTVEVLDATHPAFTEAVRAVLPRLRFAPARVGRQKVPQLVEIPFGFQLTQR